MVNKDFRQRLRNHEIEPNGDSWNQMNELLDSTCDVNAIKRKKWYFWLFLLLFIPIGMITFKNISTYKSSQKSNHILKSDKNDIVSNNQNSISTFDVTSEISINNNSKIILADDFEIVKTNTTIDFIKAKTDSRNENSTNIISVNNIDKIENSINSEINKLRSNVEKDDDFENENIISEKFQKSISNPNFNIKENNITDRVIEGVNTNIDSENLRLNIIEFCRLPDWKSKLNSDYLRNLQLKEIKPIKYNLGKFFWGLKIGYSKFNTLPGFHVGVGSLYDLNKLVSLEGDIAYTYGQENKSKVGFPYSWENQLDIGLIAHLNFFRNQRHKVSFELGSGYTFYKGERVNRGDQINIYYRQHNGIHYQGGISYTYYINTKFGMGIKYGVISYDDAITYFAFKQIVRL